VLSLLPELGVRAFVTTHFLQFVAQLAREAPPPLEFLQVELDAKEQPTYRFTAGVARTSLANRTAARLGVTREELLQRIAAKRASRGT
jgi:DNA mismatch repair protein MutS2